MSEVTVTRRLGPPDEFGETSVLFKGFGYMECVPFPAELLDGLTDDELVEWWTEQGSWKT